MDKKILFAAFALALFVVNPCYAQFSGASFFNTTPWSQMGPVTNNLILTDNVNGFTVTGQVIVAIPATATPISGILVSWTVDRPLAFPYGPALLTTTTDLDGFSAPPVGVVGNTAGEVQSIFTDYLGTTTSLSSIPMQLSSGVDLPPWINLSSTSAVFSHTASPGEFLRQTFYLDGIYNSGPGGNWVIDVPVISSVNVIPEPTTFALGGFAVLAGAGYALRRRALRRQPAS